MGSDFHGARVGPGSIPDQVRALRHKHAPAFEALHGGSEQKSTVGLVLESTLEVKGVIPGGPMDQDFDGVRVEEGDVLLAIDGEPQSEETVYSQLVGDDVVGSLVRISIRKASTGHVVHLTVTRGSFSRIQAIGELFLLFKQMLGDMAYGTAVKSQDIVRAEGQARVVSRFASEHLARLHLHVRDLEELVSEQAKLLRARSQGHRAAVAAKIRERSRLVAIWHAWRNNYLEGKRRLRINRFILRCSNAQSLSVALSKWSHSHEEARRLRAQEQMHRSRAQNQALSATFAMWKHETRRGPCSRANLEAFALRRRGKISAHVFVKWIQRRLNTRRLRTAAIRAQTKTFHRCKVEALFAWQSQAEFPKLQGMHHSHVEAQITRRHRRTRVAFAITGWQERVAEMKCVQRRAKTAMQRRRNRVLIFGLVTWRQRIRRLKRFRVAESRMMRHSQNHRSDELAHVLRRWLEEMQRRRVMSTVAAKWVQKCMHAVLNMWKSYSEFTKLRHLHHTHVEAQITRRHRRTRVAFAITGWQERVAEMKCVQRRAKTAMQRRRNRVLIFGLVTWRQRIRRLKRFRVAESRMTRHWQGQQLSIRFSNWSFEAIDAKAMANITGKFARARCHLSIASAFECLIGSVLERKRLMCVSRKVMRHCNASAAYRAYAAWDAQVFQRKEKRRARSKTLVRLKRFQAGLALRRWRNHHWEVIFNSTIACKRLLHRKISWMEFVATVQRFTLSDCFHVWVKHVQSEGSRDRGQDKLSLAWSDFLDCVTQVRISRETAQKVVSGRMHELQQKILQTWRSLAHIRHRNLLQLSSWCMRRVLKREMSRAWRRWLEEMQRRRVMSTLAAKWVQKCMHAVLNMWKSYSEFTKLRHLHHTHVEAQITRRHRRTRVAFAITGWQERVAEMKCVQRRAKTAMQRRRNRVLIFGLVTWRQRIRRLKRFRVAESRMTRHWQGQQLSIRFSNWSFEAIDAKAMANITGKFARARCHLSIASAFECLIGSVLERKRLMCVSRKVMRHCNASAAYRAYAAWDAQVFQRKEKRRARSKTLVRLKRFQAGLALRRWRNHHWEVIFNSTIACKRLLHRKISWMEFVATVQRFTLSDCFHVWVKHVQSEGSRDRGQDKLSLAWSDFLDCVTQVRISRETAQKVVSGRMHELQQKILQTWRSLAHIRHRNLLQLSSWCMRRVLKREMSRAWRRWLEEMQRRRVMSTLAAKWVQKCMHAVLNMWKSRVGVRRALLHVLKIVFLGWKDHLQSQSKSNHSGRSARNIELSETLSVWISVHRKQMDKRQRAERLIQYSLDLFRRQNVLRLSASFSSWVSNLKGLRSVREIAQEALMCWDRVRVVTPAFISWKSTYQSAREAPMLSAAGTWWTNMQRNLAMLPRSHNAYEPARLISPKKEIGSTR